MKKTVIRTIFAALITLTTFAQDTNIITKIGFSVTYTNGWSAHTDFYTNLSVRGDHISGGNRPFVHMVEDTASKELWSRLEALALKAAAVSPIDLNPNPDPTYCIRITFADGKVVEYERDVKQEYDNTHLKELCSLIMKNERIYSFQEGKPWILE